MRHLVLLFLCSLVLQGCSSPLTQPTSAPSTLSVLSPSNSSDGTAGERGSVSEPEPEQPAPVPPSVVYTCTDRAHQIAVFLASHPTLPTVKLLPSGERVYIDERGHVTHYDGPVCQ